MTGVKDVKNDKQIKTSKNRKFIVIGSLLGAIASIIGFIAIFLPNIFNLQKNRIQTLTLQVENPDDKHLIYEFLTKNKRKIVKLDISTCRIRQDECPSIVFEDGVITFTNNYDGDDCAAGDHSNGGIVFFFDQTGLEWYKFEPCVSNAHEGVNRISGYFLAPDGAGFGQGWSEWLLSSVPEKDVLLKNY